MAIVTQSIFTRIFVNDFQDQDTAVATFFGPGTPPVDKLVLRETVTAVLVDNPLHKKLEDILTLAQSVTKAKANPSAIGVSVAESIVISASRFRPIVETLVFTERIKFTLNGSAPTPSFTKIPTLTLSGGGGTTLHLRAPIFGDTEKLQFTRIGRQSRGGDLMIFQDPMWPTTDVFHFEFEYLTELQALSLIAFFKATLGKTITIVDHNSRSWDGYILTPEESIVQPKVHGFTAKFDFQNKIDI